MLRECRGAFAKRSLQIALSVDDRLRRAHTLCSGWRPNPVSALCHSDGSPVGIGTEFPQSPPRRLDSDRGQDSRDLGPVLTTMVNRLHKHNSGWHIPFDSSVPGNDEGPLCVEWLRQEPDPPILQLVVERHHQRDCWWHFGLPIVGRFFPGKPFAVAILGIDVVPKRPGESMRRFLARMRSIARRSTSRKHPEESASIRRCAETHRVVRHSRLGTSISVRAPARRRASQRV